uniref:UPF0202 protein At1g10490 family n=1 Tax=Cajanus cajan TaxID=3821 RepID=A0A151SJM0_CAJCA|nr:UPF0202 protein At1g10490 family [Cajanus cajan]
MKFRTSFFLLNFIQYIWPHEHEKLSQVELLVVEEAAAIPLLVVRIMAIYVISHYKNSPNDLQLMVDASAHYFFFVLLGIHDFLSSSALVHLSYPT